MAIALVDKEVYTVYDYEFKRSEMLTFFLDGHRDDIIIVYDEKQKYQGFITYKSLLKAYELPDILCREYVYIDETVWKNAYSVMETCEYEAVPVFDKDNTLCYFAVWDDELNGIKKKLNSIFNYGGFREIFPTETFHLQGCNEILFRLREKLLAEGIAVSVSGEPWSLFGIKAEESVPDKGNIIVEENCSQITNIFEKYCRDNIEQETIAFLQRKVKVKGKRLIFACTAQWQAQAIYGMLVERDFVPDEMVCIDGKFKDFLFGSRLSDMDKLDMDNAVVCIAGSETDKSCERLEEKLILEGIDKENIFLPLLPDKLDYDSYICNTASRSNMVVLIGDCKLCHQIHERHCQHCDRVIYVTEEQDSCGEMECRTWQECVSHQGALWFYVGRPFTEETKASYEKLFWKCQEEGIYLSDYYLNCFDYARRQHRMKEEWLERLYDIKQELNESALETAKVLFYAAPYSYFWNSLKILYQYYRSKGVPCVVVFAKLQILRGIGEKNFERMLQSMEELVAEGTPCTFVNDTRLYKYRYDLCFSNSEHSGVIGDELINSCDIVASVQTSGYYAHIYAGVTPFEAVFSESALKGIDYVIVSDFIADWVRKRTDAAEKKLLALGYPKQDDMYRKLQKKDIPEEWRRIIGSRKVILFVTYVMDEYLKYFDGRDIVIIWRPHPLLFENQEACEKIKKLEKKDNIIIDTNSSYAAAFAASNAMITTPICAPLINYLFTKKPILITPEFRSGNRN